MYIRPTHCTYGTYSVPLLLHVSFEQVPQSILSMNALASKNSQSTELIIPPRSNSLCIQGASLWDTLAKLRLQLSLIITRITLHPEVCGTPWLTLTEGFSGLASRKMSSLWRWHRTRAKKCFLLVARSKWVPRDTAATSGGQRAS